MKLLRVAVSIALCLAGGVAVSYGVALWFARQDSLHSHNYQALRSQFPTGPLEWPLPLEAWPASNDPIPPRPLDAVRWRISAGVWESHFSALGGPGIWMVTESEVGWPLACASRYETGLDEIKGWPMGPSPLRNPWYGGVHVFDVRRADGGRGPVYLPLEPRWGGLAVDSLLYGVVLWGLGWSTGAVRRLVRRRRGSCEACGYPRGPGPVCPECGRVAAGVP